MRIDAHQHFWRYSPEEYGWIDDRMRAIRTDFLPETLAIILANHGIHGTIAVQARQTLEETRWLLDLAARHSMIKAVVGWVPLVDSNVADIIGSFNPGGILKGVRHLVQSESDPAFLERAAFNQGISAVTAQGLVYDLIVFARQLPAAIALVDRHPRQIFVLDHIAKPVVQSTPPEPWQKQIRELARRENVFCKFSGVVTEAPGWKTTPELLRPYFDVVLEAFGPRRLMFGSDWPVCLVATSYAWWFEFVSACANTLSVHERARILGDTAAEIYRLS